MLKLRFGTDDGEGTMEADRATYADLTDFVFETPAALLTDASWSGQVRRGVFLCRNWHNFLPIMVHFDMPIWNLTKIDRNGTPIRWSD